MPSLEMCKKMMGGSNTIGQMHKMQSDNIMDATWWNDINSKVAYIYDYYHDDQPLENYNLKSNESLTKTPIDIKFLVNAYNSENKDQVGYHLQFKPGQKCPLDYYEESFTKKYGGEFPIGLFIDIPDEQGIYRKWLITEYANWLGTQFPTYYILPTDHLFQWIYRNEKYQMWGIGRSQNSYNAGVWVDFKIESPENQRKCIFPMNNITEKLFYNQRMIISAPIDEPLCWRITKLENISPRGINYITYAQDKYDPNHDYIEKDQDGYVIGMWADYYTDGVPVNDGEDIPDPPKIYSEITYTGIKPELKVGGSYKTFTVKFYNDEGEVDFISGRWTYEVNGIDASSLITTETSARNQIKIKVLKDKDDYIGENLVITYTSNTGIKSSVNMNIVGL